MIDVIKATPLYGFLRLCNDSDLPKEILDCGAGGDDPNIQLFYQYGYKTTGLEINEISLKETNKFCKDNNMNLNVIEGDMRKIPFKDESFSFVYSYNAISFMTKADIARSIDEMKRVLRKNGLLFINFHSKDDPDKRTFSDQAFARQLLDSEHFAFFDDYEADKYFDGMQLIRKEKRVIDKLWQGKRLIKARLDYITQKI